MGNRGKRLKGHAVPFDVRLTEKRSKIYKCLCYMEKDLSGAVQLQNLVAEYENLVRLKMAVEE